MSGLDLKRDNCRDLYNEYSEFSQIFDLLFENTVYLTRKTILSDLTKAILTWKKNRDNFSLYIILPMDKKIGSEHYYYMLNDLLPNHTIVSHDIGKVPLYSEFVFIDDWYLSGTHLLNSFEHVIYKTYF